MSADAERREQVADAIAKNPDTAMARHMLVGDIPRERLAYEDWMAALEWSDPEVCIAIEAWWAEHFDDVDAEDTRLYFRRLENGMIERAPPDGYGRQTMTHMHFAPTLGRHQERAELVLRSEIPAEIRAAFGGGRDA